MWRWVGGSNVKIPGRGESSAAGPIACGTWCSASPFATPGVPCGIFPRAVALRLPLFKGAHRFLGPLFLSAGCRIVQVPVHHRPRPHGRSHYNLWNRSLGVVFDLFGVAWLMRRSLRYQVLENQGRGYGHELKAHPWAGESSVGNHDRRSLRMLTLNGWLVVGFLGQALFTARFVVQWLVSERKRDSVVPVAFWWFSLFGGLALLSYAVSRRDPVIIVGQAMGLVVYVRNLMLVAKARRRAARRIRPTANQRRPSIWRSRDLHPDPASAS